MIEQALFNRGMSHQIPTIQLFVSYNPAVWCDTSITIYVARYLCSIMHMRAFQVQMAHFGETKGSCISHIIFRIVALYLDFFWFPGLKILSRDSKF